MKVLITIDEYCYRLNNEYYLNSLGELFIKRYLAVFDEIFLALRTKDVKSKNDLGMFKHLLQDNRVKIVPFPFFQGPRQYAKVYFKVQEISLKAAKDCDISILRLPSTIGFAIWKYLRKYKKQYITEVVYDCHDAYMSATGILEKIIWSRLHKKQVIACNYAVGVSCVTAKYLQRHYFPINKSAITTNYSTIELPQSFYYHNRKFPTSPEHTIIHVACQVEFNGRKGHSEMIQILSQVRNNNINASILFVGEDYNNGIEKLTMLAKQYGVEKYIEFAGYVEQIRLRQLLLDADIAVLPTKAEGLPRVIIEAMALGLPCVTTPVSGNSELIDEELLIQLKDIKGFSKMISRLFTDEKFYEDQSRKNFDKSLQYSSSVLNPRRALFYKNIIQLVQSKSYIP